jgi:hypothetical protein
MTALTSFLIGAGSVLDLFGTSDPPDFLEVSDADAIAGDWEFLRRDMENAIDSVSGSFEGAF